MREGNEDQLRTMSSVKLDAGELDDAIGSARAHDASAERTQRGICR